MLVVVPIVAWFLPRAWTGKLISLVQVIVPLQDAATAAGDAVGGAARRQAGPVSRDVFDALQRQKAALEHQTAALSVRVADLERETQLLTATRLWDVEGRGIGARGRLIPARIVAPDLLPWRSSRVVGAGTLQGVRRGSGVISRIFTIDQGDAGGVDHGMAVLLGEVFVGMVEQAGTHTARVKLLTDVSVEMKVRIGRFTDGEFIPLDKYFWLAGRGDERMEIRDAERRDVEAGVIRVGDTVLSDPTSDILPAAMTIGKISAVAPDRDNPLLSILSVQSAVDLTSLRRVFVYDSAPEPRR